MSCVLRVGTLARRFFPPLLSALQVVSLLFAVGASAAPGDVTRLGLDGADASGFAIARDGRTLWLAAHHSAVFVSRDRGRTFQRSPAIDCGISGDLVASPRDAAGAWVLCSGRLFETGDFGATWHDLGGAPEGGWIGLAALGDGRLFVNNILRVARVDPGGFATVLEDEIRVVDAGSDGSLWALTRDGIRRSRDGGASWEMVSSESNFGGWIAVDPVDPERLLQLTDRSDRLQRSDDGGRTFVAVGPSLEALARPRFGAGSTLYSGVLEKGAFPQTLVSRVSRDLGETWRPLRGLPPDSPGVFAVDPRHPRHAAWAPLDATAPGVWETRNGGGRWRQGGVGLDGWRVADLALEAGGQTMWAVLVGRPGALGRLWRQANDGWHRVELPAGVFDVRSVAADAITPDTVWVATNRGVFSTQDGGESWRPGAFTEEPLEFYQRAQVRSDPRAPGALYYVQQPLIYPAARLHRSVDGGDTFEDTGFWLDSIQRVVAPADGSDRRGLAGVRCSHSRSCDGEGIAAESFDGGLTWRVTWNRRFAPGEAVAFAYGPAPFDELWIVATTRGLYRSVPIDPGPPFIHLDNRHYLDLVAGAGTLYALVSTPAGDVRIKASEDAGNRWRNLGVPFDPVTAPERLEVIPGEPDRLFAIGPQGLLSIAVE